MPKGVEHTSRIAGMCNIVEVKVPLMPKGVEHLWEPETASAEKHVKVPLMPKGVEHETARRIMSPSAASESTFDAERR